MKRIHLILIIGLIHGFIFVFLIPPWQHYDEPAHFEYAWLIANRLKLPHKGDYDQNMRLALGKSLLDSSFFTPDNQPNLTDPSKPLWIGISQLTDPPLYYVIEAIPLIALKATSINLQMYVARSVSVLFLLLTIYCAYKFTQELTPDNHPLQWMVPLFIAMLPAFVGFMSAINDFVAAVGLFSLWLLLAVKLIKKFSYKYAGLLILLSILCILTQTVLYLVLLYLPIVILLSALPQKVKYLAWIFTAIGAFAAILIVFKPGDAALWLRANYQDFSSRTQITNNGEKLYALQAKLFPDTDWKLKYPSWNPGFFQLIPIEVGNRLRGKTVTVGAWVWSDQEIQAYSPGVNSLQQFQDRWLGFKQVDIGVRPKFVATVIQIPGQQERMQLWLRATSPDAQDAKLYYSGVVLAEGTWPVDEAPHFNDPSGRNGIWGDQSFTNLIRNAQFQHVWPMVRPQLLGLLGNRIQGLNPIHISSFLSLFLDPSGTSWYTKLSSEVIFQTFWAKFAWGQVPLLSISPWLRPYLILFIITVIGLLGFILTGFPFLKNHIYTYTFLLIVIMITIIVSLLYGAYTMGGAIRYRAFIPTARYIDPVVLPIALLLVIGWNGLLTRLHNLLKFPQRYSSVIYLGFLIGLDIYSLTSILIYFY